MIGLCYYHYYAITTITTIIVYGEQTTKGSKWEMNAAAPTY